MRMIVNQYLFVVACMREDKKEKREKDSMSLSLCAQFASVCVSMREVYRSFLPT